jgi:hypothetical protein
MGARKWSKSPAGGDGPNAELEVRPYWQRFVANLCLILLLITASVLFLISGGGEWGGTIAWTIARTIPDHYADRETEGYAVLSALGLVSSGIAAAVSIDDTERNTVRWLGLLAFIYLLSVWYFTPLLSGWQWTICDRDDNNCSVYLATVVKFISWMGGTPAAVSIGALFGRSLVGLLWCKN